MTLEQLKEAITEAEKRGAMPHWPVVMNDGTRVNSLSITNLRREGCVVVIR